MVDLTYNLCLYALRDRRREVERTVTKILSFSPETQDILNSQSKNAQEFAGGLFAEDDETLGKFHDVDETTGLLVKTHFPQDNQRFLQTLAEITKRGTSLPFDNEQIGGVMSRKHRIGFFLKNVRSEKNIPSEREIAMWDLVFPESVICDTRRELRRLLTERQAEQYPADRGGRFYAPIGVYRYIHLDPAEEKPLADLMRRVLTKRYGVGDEQIVTNPRARDCALNFMRPLNLYSKAGEKLRETRDEIIHRLNQPFQYLLRPGGEQVLVVDKILNEGLGIKTVTFSPEEHFTRVNVQIQFGKYTISLLVDEQYNLLGADGKSLNIDDESLAWWQTFVLNYLSDFVCEDEGVKSSVDGEQHEEEGEKTAVVGEIIERKEIKPHRVRLPQDHRFTEKQRERVLLLTNGLLDLQTYNATMEKITPGQGYTWAFPSERYADEFMRKRRKPKVYRMRKTEKRLEEIMNAAD